MLQNECVLGKIEPDIAEDGPNRGRCFDIKWQGLVTKIMRAHTVLSVTRWTPAPSKEMYNEVETEKRIAFGLLAQIG